MGRKIAIVKLGSSSVTRDEGPDPVIFAQTMQSISRARAVGWSIVLVSSGAAALGSVLLAPSLPFDSTGQTMPSRPPSRHLRSSVGQPELMSLYRFLGDACRVNTCQLLLSANDLQDPQRMERVARLINEALDAGRLPILNGNDSTDESVYDNDSLATSIAIACHAEHVLLLSDVPAVLEPDGTEIVQMNPTEALRVRAILGSSTGTGGIQSKVRSASLAALNGVVATIAEATAPKVIERVLAGERIGTRFPAQQLKKSTPRSLWIGGIASTGGRVMVNLEAEESITKGASLFGSGVKRVMGNFPPNSIVEITDPRGRLIGRGSIRVSSDLLNLVRAMPPAETVSLYLWLLGRLADYDDTYGVVASRAARAIESAKTYSPEQMQAMGREILAMFPALAAGALLGKASGDIAEALLNQTYRFSLVDNRSLVIFPTSP